MIYGMWLNLGLAFIMLSIFMICCTWFSEFSLWWIVASMVSFVRRAACLVVILLRSRLILLVM